jgi:tetratricopeptide (TPR) repeat protein
VNLYPLLRVVKFDFYLHRKGMIKDTIHTTEIDTIYRNGLIALEKREYEKAIEYLRPYSDFNTALAYSCLDYNASALSILEKLPQSAKRDYMLAILYSRQGKDKKAVKHYLFSIEQDQSMIHRGNLDPEISVLIKKYNINNY